MNWKSINTAPNRKLCLVRDDKAVYEAMNDRFDGRDCWCTSAGALDGRVFPTQWLCESTPPSEGATQEKPCLRCGESPRMSGRCFCIHCQPIHEAYDVCPADAKPIESSLAEAINHLFTQNDTVSIVSYDAPDGSKTLYRIEDELGDYLTDGHDTWQAALLAMRQAGGKEGSGEYMSNENSAFKKEGERAFQLLDEPRCPHCGKSFNPGEQGCWEMYKEGEHVVFCQNEDCGLLFECSTQITHSFTTRI